MQQGGDGTAIAAELQDEENQERERDRAYWLSLKAELEHLRRAARHSQ